MDPWGRTEMLLLTNSNCQIYLFGAFYVLFLDEIVLEVSLLAWEVIIYSQWLK